MHHTGIRPDGLRKIADNLDLVADQFDRRGETRHSEIIRQYTAFLRRTADQVVHLETQMGRVNDAITYLKADRDGQKHRADTAEQKWKDAVESGAVNDAADLAALSTLEAEEAANAGGTNAATTSIGAATNTTGT